jgi:hypothetical protein
VRAPNRSKTTYRPLVVRGGPKAKAPQEKKELTALQTRPQEKITGPKAIATGTLRSKHPGWIAYAVAWGEFCDTTLASGDVRLL